MEQKRKMKRMKRRSNELYKSQCTNVDKNTFKVRFNINSAIDNAQIFCSLLWEEGGEGALRVIGEEGLEAERWEEGWKMHWLLQRSLTLYEYTLEH